MTKPAVQLSELLGTNTILVDQEASSKKDLLQALAKEAAEALGLEEHLVFNVLWEREKLGTTGVGHGIAIPHGRIEGLDKVCGFFTRLSSPITFESVDEQPVDLVFLLLAPESAGADHLHALASVSRTLRDIALCTKLRKASHKDLYKLLTKAPSAVAA